MAIPTRFRNDPSKVATYRAILLRSGIMEYWHLMSFDNFESDLDYEKLLTEHIDNGDREGVILLGPNGTGKTMLLNLSMMYAIEQKHSVYVLDFRDLVQQYIKGWRSEGLLQTLLAVDYLGVDDIGKEFSSSEVSKELAITALDYVMRKRYQMMKPTWITTNMALGEFKTDYNNHIASLLKRCMVSVDVVGKDYGDRQFRKVKAPQR